MPLHDPVISCKSRGSYGAHVLDHLAADGAGLAGGQIAVIAVFQVDADLGCSFHFELVHGLTGLRNVDRIAVAFREGSVKHVYFVAETKGNDIEVSQLRRAEDAKIECARRHFAAISTGEVVYSVVKTYQDLYNVAMK